MRRNKKLRREGDTCLLGIASIQVELFLWVSIACPWIPQALRMWPLCVQSMHREGEQEQNCRGLVSPWLPVLPANCRHAKKVSMCLLPPCDQECWKTSHREGAGLWTRLPFIHAILMSQWWGCTASTRIPLCESAAFMEGLCDWSDLVLYLCTLCSVAMLLMEPWCQSPTESICLEVSRSPLWK